MMVAVAAAWQECGVGGGNSMVAAVAAAAGRWQQGDSGGGGGSAVAVASLASEAAAWWKCNFWRQQQRVGKCGGSMVAAGATRHWRWQHGIGGGGDSSGSAVGSAVAVGEGRDVLAMCRKKNLPFF